MMTEENKQTVEQHDEDSKVVYTEATAVEVDQQQETAPEQLSELELVQAKLDEQENSYLRLRADFDNYRRRVQKDTEAASKFRAQSLVTDLLPVLDNFERAIDTNPQTEEAQTLLKGVEMVYRSLKTALDSEGVREIAPDGDTFDPNFHQAVIQEASEEHASGTVIQTLQKGYQLKDRVIRPAMVKVSE
ncbi:nucleotide exchange factor GrpE [Chryseomicrobium sp. FSL W7-1435]|uniref:nucleotide exchange factor GrpE n=2 Tax=Chryseomicrobium sp. FSL W7-1435 TaxID=2921704 RepID=UPI00315AD80B